MTCLISLFNLPTLSPSWTADLLDDFSEKHRFGFNIYKLSGNTAELSIDFPGQSRFEKSVAIGARTWPSKTIYWLPSTKNIAMKYQCNKSDDCGYTSTRSNNVKIHEQSCKMETEINAKPE